MVCLNCRRLNECSLKQHISQFEMTGEVKWSIILTYRSDKTEREGKTLRETKCSLSLCFDYGHILDNAIAFSLYYITLTHTLQYYYNTQHYCNLSEYYIDKFIFTRKRPSLRLYPRETVITYGLEKRVRIIERLCSQNKHKEYTQLILPSNINLMLGGVYLLGCRCRMTRQNKFSRHSFASSSSKFIKS